ncbi:MULTISPECIES: zinc finger domain-containing protein [unclassified Streptomyces]|uniref:zinc finger domain-containing protein n=1 Tax=unclassified Streptomyces TaxID=2593676 RepID=UPI003FA382A9
MFHELLQKTGSLKHPHQTLRCVTDDFTRVEAHDCPTSTCAAPAGSPCRTGKGMVAIQYHTARFRLAPHLAEELEASDVGPAPLTRHRHADAARARRAGDRRLMFQRAKRTPEPNR